MAATFVDGLLLGVAIFIVFAQIGLAWWWYDLALWLHGRLQELAGLLRDLVQRARLVREAELQLELREADLQHRWEQLRAEEADGARRRS